METIMPRQSITLTQPNDEWLAAQVESKEFSSKSEAVNELIRRVRRFEDENEYIRQALIQGEKSGTSKRTAEEIREAARAELKADGYL